MRKKREYYPAVPAHNKTIYITEDGNEFYTEKEAIEHEKLVRKSAIFKKIRKSCREIIFDELPSDIYFIENDEEAEVFLSQFGKNTITLGEIKAGEWVSWLTTDGEDYRLVSLRYAREAAKKYIEEVDKILEENNE